MNWFENKTTQLIALVGIVTTYWLRLSRALSMLID